MKKKYTLALLAILAYLPGLTYTAAAQATKMPVQEQKYILVKEASDPNLANPETLSGINLHRAKKGTYQLDFEKQLKEDALLMITNTAGKKVYEKPIAIADRKNAWRYNVGKLRPDTYLVEVKTSNTTYWTKFKVK